MMPLMLKVGTYSGYPQNVLIVLSLFLTPSVHILSLLSSSSSGQNPSTLDFLTAGPGPYTAIKAWGLQIRSYMCSQLPEDTTGWTSLASHYCKFLFLESFIAWSTGHATTAFHFKLGSNKPQEGSSEALGFEGSSSNLPLSFFTQFQALYGKQELLVAQEHHGLKPKAAGSTGKWIYLEGEFLLLFLQKRQAELGFMPRFQNHRLQTERALSYLGRNFQPRSP